MKILYVTTVGSTMDFFKSFIKKLVVDGSTVDIATNSRISQVSDFYENLNCKIYKIDTSRSPLNKDNILAYRQVSNIVNKENFDIVHCHTPVASIVTRLASRKARKRYGTKVIYTAHGFHFFKGAPLINWLLYYSIEWFCSFFTDVLITINKEDYSFAKKHMHAKKIEYIPGVGIDTEKIESITVNREEKRKELGIDENRFVVLSVGELNDNKNHETIIKAIAKLDRNDITYVICGRGEKEEYLKELAIELGVDLKLLGFRNDVIEIYKCSDIFAFPSKREGLPVSLMEAMACGCLVVCSEIRGNVDLISDNYNGFLCKSTDILDYSTKIDFCLKNDMLREKFCKNSLEVIRKFDVKNVNSKIKEIYSEV